MHKEWIVWIYFTCCTLTVYDRNRQKSVYIFFFVFFLMYQWNHSQIHRWFLLFFVNSIFVKLFFECFLGKKTKTKVKKGSTNRKCASYVNSIFRYPIRTVFYIYIWNDSMRSEYARVKCMFSIVWTYHTIYVYYMYTIWYI